MWEDKRKQAGAAFSKRMTFDYKWSKGLSSFENIASLLGQAGVFCIIFTFCTVFHFLALYFQKIALLLANQNWEISHVIIMTQICWANLLIFWVSKLSSLKSPSMKLIYSKDLTE
jgi:hypothetical protein